MNKKYKNSKDMATACDQCVEYPTPTIKPADVAAICDAILLL